MKKEIDRFGSLEDPDRYIRYDDGSVEDTQTGATREWNPTSAFVRLVDMGASCKFATPKDFNDIELLEDYIRKSRYAQQFIITQEQADAITALPRTRIIENHSQKVLIELSEVMKIFRKAKDD